jgi:membrane protein implicated in regulation of membrane protease activity
VSAPGALFIALSAIVVLGAFAAWLLNVPAWAIGAFVAAGILVIRRVYRRMARGRARQEPEASKN